MKSILSLFFILMIGAASGQNPAINRATVKEQRNILFDDNWLFKKDSTIDAHEVNYNDRSWRIVHLPHDWSIEDLDPQIPGRTSGPFDTKSTGANATGFVDGGTGWYRKKFTRTKEDQSKAIRIYFDGVYMNSDVWINGHYLGNHPYGYTPFYYELTSFLLPAGQENILAVRVRNQGKNSRWYSGSGIYRHVWLIKTNPEHIAQWGVFVTTPVVTEGNALVNINTTFRNENGQEENLVLETELLAPDGSSAGKQRTQITATDKAQDVQQTIRISSPALWSTDNPKLYTAVSRLLKNKEVVDVVTTHFGVRTIQVDARNGFLLNGKKLELRGGCMHHDNGPLGSATIDRAEERKIEILKKNGFNAIRTSHNPPSQQLLDACDRLGMLVIDEAFDMWERGKNDQDYHLYFDQWWQQDLSSMLLRDRNHPSVVFWSIGNEVNERADSSGLVIASKLVNFVHQIDSTRPVTEAICHFWDHPGRQWEATAPAFALLDVGGYNYMWKEYQNDHRLYPNRIMMGTESVPKELWENWMLVESLPYVIGDFVWTAVDYMGETAIGHSFMENRKDSFSLGWPWYDSWCGDIDLTGNKKPQSYFRDVVWRRSKIEMAVHQPIGDSAKETTSYWGWPLEEQSWTWPGAEGKMMQVRVFSRSPMVRLELNGKIVGEQKMADSSITAVFHVPYQSGTLKAIAVENGKEVGSVELKTTGQPRKIRLIADRSTIHAGSDDLSYVTAEITDEKGNLVPYASIPIHFELTGAATIAALGSGDPVDMRSFHLSVRKSFRGRCLAIIRTNGKKGKIELKASGAGLEAATVVVNSE
ncbi:MAG: glycoside hydrolase family 2 TIM barrel-domain containing protein [Flavisolibacter sp.]